MYSIVNYGLTGKHGSGFVRNSGIKDAQLAFKVVYFLSCMFCLDSCYFVAEIEC
jgi:hypothetical protein